MNYKQNLNNLKIFLGNNLPGFNSLLSKCKTPHNLGRKIKQIDEKIKLKSNELKIFLFYRAIPILIDILPTNYFYYLASYVIAIRILYEPIQNNELIVVARDILENYVNNLKEEFGLNAYDYNLHEHLHLADQVVNHGPLKSHSQFVFEV